MAPIIADLPGVSHWIGWVGLDAGWPGVFSVGLAGVTRRVFAGRRVRRGFVGGWVYSEPVFEYGSPVRTRGGRSRRPSRPGSGIRGPGPGRSALPATHRPPGRRATTEAAV